VRAFFQWVKPSKETMRRITTTSRIGTQQAADQQVPLSDGHRVDRRVPCSGHGVRVLRSLHDRPGHSTK
jgi:hypothetical protein